MTADNSSTTIRRRVVYTGRVQGVCFRATTQDLSRGFKVVGHVCNLRDGTVELEAEGSSEQVGAFLDVISRQFQHNLQHTQTDEMPVRGDESNFEIQY
ncbi:MAG: acylphosphatase [Planctomycetota bacterium]